MGPRHWENRTEISQEADSLFARGGGGCRVLYPGGPGQADCGFAAGQEAVVAMLEGGAFLGESGLAGQTVRPTTAIAVEDSRLVRIDKEVMIRLLHEEPAFSELFLTHLLSRNMRIQEDVVEFQREAAGAGAAVTGPLRERRPYGGLPSEAQPGNARRDDRHHARPRQFLHD